MGGDRIQQAPGLSRALCHVSVSSSPCAFSHCDRAGVTREHKKLIDGRNTCKVFQAAVRRVVPVLLVLRDILGGGGPQVRVICCTSQTHVYKYFHLNVYSTGTVKIFYIYAGDAGHKGAIRARKREEESRGGVTVASVSILDGMG